MKTVSLALRSHFAVSGSLSARALFLPTRLQHQSALKKGCAVSHLHLSFTTELTSQFHCFSFSRKIKSEISVRNERPLLQEGHPCTLASFPSMAVFLSLERL